MTTTQLDAARVLTGIIRRAEEAGLPRLSWKVWPTDGAGLEAQPYGRDDEADLAGLDAWAAHLGVEVAVRQAERYVDHTVRAEVDGVKVHIFTHTDRSHTYVSVPVDQAGGAR